MLKNINNEIVCFTGKSLHTRIKMQQLAINQGAKITANITRETTLLVVGKRAGSKLERAFMRDIRIVADEEFLQVIERKKQKKSLL